VTWLTPLAGLILAAALIPPLILLYFLKLRRKPMPVACTMLWMTAREDLQANAPFQRLRRNLLLFLQLLALILLAIALMQPQVQAGQFDGGRVVILIDNSASMSATDGPGGLTRLDIAKRLARDRIEAMYGGGMFTSSPDETMIVAFSDRAEIISRFTNSRQQLLDAIDRIRPTHGETRLEEALQLARAYTTNVVDEMGEARPTGEPAHIELFSDGRIADLADQVLRGESITFHAIGTDDPDNVAFAAISAERPFDRPTHIEVFASMINFNQYEVSCDVQLSVNGTARGIREINIPAARLDDESGELRPGRNNVSFAPFEMARGAVIELANLRPDALLADNIAQIVIAPARRLNVAIVSPQGWVIRNVVDSIEPARLDILTRAQYEERAAVGPLDEYDVIIFDGYEPENLPAGRYLCFGPPPPIEGLNPYGRADRQLILTTREDHPVMQHVNMDRVFIRDFVLMQPARDVTILAEGNQSPAIVHAVREQVSVIHVAFDPLDTYWPYERSYVYFILNAIEFLGHFGDAVISQTLRPGQAISTRLPSSATDVQLIHPDGRVESLNVADPTQVSWGPIELAGVYTLQWREPNVTEPQLRAIAVNLLSETEGDLRVQDEFTIGRDEVIGHRAGRTAYVPLWPWAVGLCIALLLIEWWVYHRKTAM
jgi:Mg-chelatase subunit ChlD